MVRMDVAAKQIELPVVSLLHRLPPARLTGYISAYHGRTSYYERVRRGAYIKRNK
ncbi:hypothetical protein LMG7143_01103 [Ralstonia thomasii]|nr:hypothetical protein LMG7143_01103 [Ralstonia sp. LMG 18095]